jgi:hypothetical protein
MSAEDSESQHRHVTPGARPLIVSAAVRTCESAHVADIPEIPLAGGMVSTVVRVGETVRRPIERWSAGVHGLLSYLESVEFDAAPRFLGIDDQRREILSWIPGMPASRPWPEPLLRDEGVISLGRLLRTYHDAVADYDPPAGTEWWTGARPRSEGEVIRHGDVGPWNTIWRDDRAVAFIDWDFVEPGPAVRDLAEMAFFVTPMRDDIHCDDCGFREVPNRAHRLRVLCDAYGWGDLRQLVDAVEEHWEEDIQRIATLGPQGIKP